MSYKETRQTESKKDSKCSICKGPIKKGSPCIVDPKKKEVRHVKCESKDQKK
jgi:hypothetical protein